MDAERIDRWCERGIFGLTLFILVFGPLAIGAVRWFEFIYIQTAVMTIGALWLVRCWIKPTFELFWPPVCWAVLAILGYAAVRYLQADVEYVARLEFMRICVYALFFVAAVNNLHRQEYLQIIVWTLVGLATVISLFALVQFATGASKIWTFYKPALYVHRASGTYINPNHLAGFMELILPIGLAMLFLGRISHVMKIILAYACALLLVSIGVSLSRGGWMATTLTLVCFLVALIIQSGRRWIIISCVLVLFAGMMTYLASSVQFQNRFAQTFVTGKVGDVRFDYWKPAIQMWKDHPWTGVGPAHFDVRFPQYRPKEVQARPQFAHNDYLNTLADWGVIGGVIIVTFVVLLYLGVLQASEYLRRKTENGEGKSNRAAIVFGTGFSVLAMLLHSVTDFNMQIPANVILLLILVAMTMTQLRYSERFWFAGSVVTKAVLTVFLLSLLAVMGFNGVRKAKEDVWLHRALLSKTWDDKFNALKQAAVIEPSNPTTLNSLGEMLRQESFRGDAGYEKLAEEAMTWFQQAIKLNPFSPYNYLGYGMSLDWLKRTKEAEPYFAKALELDPNSYYVVAYQGWHQAQLENYPAAEQWFDKSIGIWWNDFAVDYINIVRQRMAEKAAETAAAPKH